MVKIQPTSHEGLDKWQEITNRSVDSVAGIIYHHLSSSELEGVTDLAPVDPSRILPFESAVLPADKNVLARLFPGYNEPTQRLLDEMSSYAKDNYGTAPGETAALIVQLVKAIQPETAFVFGTARGRIEQLIAQNNATAEVVTLDLPTELLGFATGKPDGNNIRYRKQLGVIDDAHIGSIFSEDPQIAGRVHQILGDSFTFSCGQLSGSMRMVVVDGNHQLPNALMDLGNALELCHTRGGIIVVDDFRKASPLNMGVEAAAAIFSQITNLHILAPCPKPGESGLQAPAAIIVVPSGFERENYAAKVREMAKLLKSY